MVILFWLSTILLSTIALLFIFPAKALKGNHKAFLCFIFIFSTYPIYYYLGNGSKLKSYYSKEALQQRQTQMKMRPLFSELKKQQGRLRLRLMDNPDDSLSKALLLELLGVEALHEEAFTLSLRYWEAALTLLPKGEKTKIIRNRIQGLKNRVEEKYQMQ
jgi:hypothetical protein